VVASNFASIQEALEHKLQFGPLANGNNNNNNNNEPQLRSLNLFGKLRNRLANNRAPDGENVCTGDSVRAAGEHKLRPAISAPSNFRSANGPPEALASSQELGFEAAPLGHSLPLQTLDQGPHSVHAQQHDAWLAAATSGHAHALQQSAGDQWLAAAEQQQQLYANYGPAARHAHPLGAGPGERELCEQSGGGAHAPAHWPPQQPQPEHQQHYQMPALMSEQYLAQVALEHHSSQANQQQQLGGHHHHQQHQQQQQQYATATLAAGKLATTFFLPTTDGGDAFYESNYGTLLSNSSAYKTLGYAHKQPAKKGPRTAAGLLVGEPQAALATFQQQQQHLSSGKQLGSNGTSETSPVSSTSPSSSSSSSSSSASSCSASSPRGPNLTNNNSTQSHQFSSPGTPAAHTMRAQAQQQQQQQSVLMMLPNGVHANGGPNGGPHASPPPLAPGQFPGEASPNSSHLSPADGSTQANSSAEQPSCPDMNQCGAIFHLHQQHQNGTNALQSDSETGRSVATRTSPTNNTSASPNGPQTFPTGHTKSSIVRAFVSASNAVQQLAMMDDDQQTLATHV